MNRPVVVSRFTDQSLLNGLMIETLFKDLITERLSAGSKPAQWLDD